MLFNLKIRLFLLTQRVLVSGMETLMQLKNISLKILYPLFWAFCTLFPFIRLWSEKKSWPLNKHYYIQICRLEMAPLLNKYYWNEVTLTRQNPSLEQRTFDTVKEKFRSFNAENLKSLGQWAAKLPAVKLWEWFNPRWNWIWANWFERGRGRMADFFLRPPTLTAGNFEALQPTDFKFSALIDWNVLKRQLKYQEAINNFRVGFALSNGPHFPS